MKHENIELNFDFWSNMAHRNPDSFEDMRVLVINEFIDSVPMEKQESLRRLQWRIDQERRLTRTPMAACLIISRMMWDTVLGDGGMIDHMQDLSGLLQNNPVVRPRLGRKPGQVLPFYCPVGNFPLPSSGSD